MIYYLCIFKASFERWPCGDSLGLHSFGPIALVNSSSVRLTARWGACLQQGVSTRHGIWRRLIYVVGIVRTEARFALWPCGDFGTSRQGLLSLFARAGLSTLTHSRACFRFAHWLELQTLGPLHTIAAIPFLLNCLLACLQG